MDTMNGFFVDLHDSANQMVKKGQGPGGSTVNVFAAGDEVELHTWDEDDNDQWVLLGLVKHGFWDGELFYIVDLKHGVYVDHPTHRAWLSRVVIHHSNLRLAG